MTLNSVYTKIRTPSVRAQVEEPLHNPLLHERIRGFSFG